MYKLFTFILLCLSVTISIQGNALTSDSIQKNTYLYAVKKKDSLYMDRYELPSYKDKKKACIMFVFGGGFVGGSRDRKDYISYFKHLANKGYSVVSIDYRLGLKKVAEQAKKEKEKGVEPKKTGALEFLSIFDNTISMAVEDLFDATNYVIEHADEWNIDKDMIVASGSSAGAITVLHAEYNICNSKELSKKLPKDFNYAGIISFAGAIFSMEGDLKWAAQPSPIQLFHGDSDGNVPYDELRAKILGIKTKYGFFGSKHIAKQLDKMQYPYYFYDVERATHEIADSPMQKNLNEIDTFLDKFVRGKENLIINTKVQQPDKPLLKRKFSIKDYLVGNGIDGKKKE